MAMILEVLRLLLFDAIFVGLLLVALLPLVIYKKAALAVMKRNFIGYFSNPTGYVFLCLFVLLTSLAAFWPHEFFNRNLANLDQLTAYLPLIMLIFIPAITMGIWAEERRQGTDELLLTLPANDFDIVIGKYLAAAAIFTASLLFSQLSNYTVLVSLTGGDLDTGLFFATYLGYWLTGLAMLAIGMIASFITSNLTVGFILGVVFNSPLVYAMFADAIIPRGEWARWISQWSIMAQIDDFSRGVISLSAIAYFLMLIVVGLYLSLVLIGRRHWTGGRDGHAMLGHYLGRAVALVVITLAANVILSNYDVVRYDATRGKVSSLSPRTRELIRNLNPEHRIRIDAYVSAQVPQRYAGTKYDLVSMLKEFRSMAGADIDVRIYHNLQTFSEEAALAEERFGIAPHTVRVRERGAFRDEEIIMGAAFTSGLEQVVVPFFDYGVPVEYELVRSITTVAEGTRRKLGVVQTDAQLFGGFTFAGGAPQQIPRYQILSELEKQYDVEEVDPSSPIPPDAYDVLLVAQPSSLDPQELPNVIAAIEAGVPTAIFEDGFPLFVRHVPATGDPKQAPGGGMFGGGGPMPKGDIQQLWRAIGIQVPGRPVQAGPGGTLYAPNLVWQTYQPYRELEMIGIPNTWVFTRNEAPGADNAINQQHAITAGINEVLLPVPHAIEPDPNSDLQFTPLLSTGTFAGTIRFEELRQYMGHPQMLRARQGPPDQEPLVLAAHITGLPAEEGQPEPAGGDADLELGQPSEDGAEAAPAETAEHRRPINVVYVGDLDLMIDAFLMIRARPDEDHDIDWQFENVTFVLNLVDVLSGEDQFVPIRTRKPHHSTLKLVERRTSEARERELLERTAFQRQFEEEMEKAEDENQQALQRFQQRIQQLQQRQREGDDVDFGTIQHAMQQLSAQQEILQRRLDIRREQLERQRDQEIERIQRDVDLDIQRIQNQYKMWAVVLPPIPPFLVGLVVFVRRRLREREGVSKARLR